MSRIGKQPIIIPPGVTVSIEGLQIFVKGPNGENKLTLHPHVMLSQSDGALQVAVKNPDEKGDRALWGLHRALIANLVQGTVLPFSKRLEFVGVGYKVAVQGKKLVLELGFSHPIEISIPEGLTCAVEKNVLSVSSPDAQQVGAFAAKVRSFRKPEPYKGKGIKYEGEIIRRKAGKAAKATGVK